MRWQVQDAKQRFSELLRAVEAGEPQIVTKHGEEVAVMIDIAEYRRLRGETIGFMQYLQSGPTIDDDLDLERSDEAPRDIDLAG
jgi:prevent-host-death family protein